jgi:putative transposase
MNASDVSKVFSTPNKELVYQTTFATHEEARLAVFEFIEGDYNRWRLRSSLGYETPVDFEAQGLERLAA